MLSDIAEIPSYNTVPICYHTAMQPHTERNIYVDLSHTKSASGKLDAALGDARYWPARHDTRALL